MYEDLQLLDSIRLNFSSASLQIMNICISFIMFGVALEIKWAQMKDVLIKPAKVIVGLTSQFIVLPAVTFFLVIAFRNYITHSVAFGLLLVASCPGGNISNFISSIAKGNVPLSVSLTAAGTLLAIVFTPFNFALWGGLYSSTSPMLRPISIDPMDMFQTIVILLGVPVALGIWISQKFPNLTAKIKAPISKISILIFILFIILAFRNNYEFFIKHIGWIFLIVFIHNAVAISSGYIFSSLFSINQVDKRTIAIETGIQNSGLGLVLLFNPSIFPSELQVGGMAFIAAWWGIWHIISGLGLATFWSFIKPVEKLSKING